MEIETSNSFPRKTGVKATVKLGLETYSIDVKKGTKVSEQLVSMKEQSMIILKEFITKHNVPNDVPDESVDGSSEEDEEVAEKSHMKSKKTKFT